MEPKLATHDDLRTILKELKEKKWVTVGPSNRSFYYCKRFIEKSFLSNDLWVIMEGEVAASFLAGDPKSSCIKVLNTKKGFEGKGYGKELAHFYIKLSKKRGHTLIWLQCRPFRSIHFWEKVGFRSYDERFGTNYSNQNAILDLVEPCKYIARDTLYIKICFIFYKMQISLGSPFIRIHQTAGSITSNQRINLKEPLVLYCPPFIYGREVRVVVYVNGKVVLKGDINGLIHRSLGLKKHNKETYSMSSLKVNQLKYRA